MSYWFEDIAPAFVELVERARGEHEAPNFASELSMRGARPEALRTMAADWRAGGFEPEQFAGELEELATIVERVAQFGRVSL